MKTIVLRIIGRIGRDALLLHTGLLFMATIMTSVCGIGYQMIVSRALPKSEYALLATFLALVAIASRPLATLSTAMAHYISLLEQDGRSGAIHRLLLRWIIFSGLPSVVLAVVVVLLSSHIASFFHLERQAPIIVVALALPVVFVAPVLGGGMIGLQRFGWSAVSSIGGAIGRVILGGAFVLLIAPTCGWALAGHVGGLYVSLIVCFFVLVRYVIQRNSKDLLELPSLRLYLMQCFIIQISAAVLMTGDVVMVQRYLPDDSGFAFAATLGRMVAFMAVGVASAMFPKVSSKGEFYKEHRQIYIRSQVFTGAFVIMAMAVCCLVPELLHRLLFKITDPDAVLISQTRGMAVAMGLSTLLNTNVSLLLAQRRFIAGWVVIGAAAFYIVGTYYFHGSALIIVVIGSVVNLLALVLTTIAILRIRCSTVENEDS